MSNRDILRINELRITALVGLPGEPQPILSSNRLSLSLIHDVRKTAQTDDIRHTINYATLSSELILELQGSNRTFTSPDDLANGIVEFLQDAGIFDFHIHLDIDPEISAQECTASAIEIDCTFSKELATCAVNRIVHILELNCPVLIGINTSERKFRQRGEFQVAIEQRDSSLSPGHWLGLRHLCRTLQDSLKTTSYFTLEALATHTADNVLRQLCASRPFHGPLAVTIKAAKPSALSLARSAEIEITRTLTDFPGLLDSQEIATSSTVESKSSDVISLSAFGCHPLESDGGISHIAMIALGSNVGDSFYNIELALRLLEVPERLSFNTDVRPEVDSVSVVDTSFLYKSTPMYVTDQPDFINCACMVKTTLEPRTLLKFLKEIERLVGRIPSIRNGPRAVDLDIIFYDDLIIDTRAVEDRKHLDNLSGHLVIPHPRMTEREFVLRPIFDMVADFVHPVHKKSIRHLLAQLQPSDPPIARVIPFPQYPSTRNSTLPVQTVPQTLSHWILPSIGIPTVLPRKTHIMATLNVTPDSFSDGSDHCTVDTAIQYVEEAAEAGASIIDVGGYSTRPGAMVVAPDEETRRVVPVIQAIRQHPDSRVQNILISVDTFRPEVAAAAITAGANCINDVYAFTGPNSYSFAGHESGEAMSYMQAMKKVARDMAVPVVAMHSRGDAGENKDYQRYTYASGDGGAVVEGVRIELGEKVDPIVKGEGSVRRWFVIIDPGVGFSKSVEGNLEVLRDARHIVADTIIGKGQARKRNPLARYPMLIGPSRKSFLGVILKQGTDGRETNPKERSWATAATVACAVQQGALVVRVHDVKEMADVAKVADVLWTYTPYD